MAYLKTSVSLLILTLAAGASPACAIERDRSRSDLPNLMFWAWERSEDLRFIDPNKVGVAYLVATLQLTSTGVEAIPRRQPLKVPEGTRLMGVIRVQAEPGQPLLDRTQRDEALARILFFVDDQKLEALQIDFDARASERGFYRKLLVALRDELPADCFLSMTALASWCLYDTWIADLPVDEAVPMMFRMGLGATSAISYFSHAQRFLTPLAEGSLGMATDEPLFVPPPNRRLYLFSSEPWTSNTYEKFLESTREAGQ